MPMDIQRDRLQSVSDGDGDQIAGIDCNCGGRELSVRENDWISLHAIRSSMSEFELEDKFFLCCLNKCDN